MIKREKYLQALRQVRDINLIKIVSGVRRSGKSTLLEQFRTELLDSGVKKSNIIFFNLEEKENYQFTQDPDLLHDIILKMCDKTTKNYVFLDEIQMVPEFERTLDSLFVRKYIDLYITGSNAYMTSSDLATLLSGRYINIKMQPLVFSEFVQFFPEKTPAEAFELFLQYGGFPEVANLIQKGSTDQITQYLRDIYDTVLEKDIKANRDIRNLEDFRNVALFTFDNIGNLTSPGGVANTLSRKNHPVDNETVDGYLEALSNCYLLYNARRFDIRGKKLLRTLGKYYTVDLGLSAAVLGKSTRADIGHRLENIVYLELLHRYRDVWIGKNYEKEIDFVVRDADGLTEYYQVSQTLANPKTLARELSPLKNTGDGYQKTVLTLDLFSSDEEGVQTVNLIDWLLGKS